MKLSVPHHTLMPQQQNKHKRQFPALWKITVLLFFASAFGYQLFEYLRPYQTYVVASNCVVPQNMIDVPLVQPELCPPRNNTLYWHDSGNYTFQNFAPCGDEEGRVECTPFSAQSRIAFIPLSYWNATNKRFELATFAPVKGIKKLFRFQLKPTSKIVFFQNNLLYRPLVKPSDVKDVKKTTIYNFHVQKGAQINGSLAETIFQMTLSKLCSENHTVNLFLHSVTDETRQKYKNTCATLIQVNLSEMCAGLPCAEFLPTLFKHKSAKFFPLQINSLIRLLIAYKYGGWIMDSAVFVKKTFVPTSEMLFYYDDTVATAVPTMHFGYFNKESLFVKDALNKFMDYYNVDCYNCLDTGLIKGTYGSQDFGIEIGSTEFYLPQLSSKKMFKLFRLGRFDNEAYNWITTKSQAFYWSLRYIDTVEEPFCDSKNILYSVIAETLSNQKICN